MSQITPFSVCCCIAGGGPAGMMLGLLLARAGVEVVVLEKHADFLRDFRGDTIHPSTLELMHELGLLEDFLKLPHQQAHRLNAQFGDLSVPFADFTHLSTRCKFLVFMPQWSFLHFLAERASRYPTFRMQMNAEVTGLIEESGRIVGVHAVTPGGLLEMQPELVVAADGRSSLVREKASLQVQAFGAPMDVLWFRLSRRPDDPEATMGRVAIGRPFVLINRGAYWQCGFVIPKGSVDELRGRGLVAFRLSVRELVPFAGDRVDEIRDWNDVKLLTVRVDRLIQWSRPGLLCIGDAAHAMSPVGGVGINLAIQDAVATANLLAQPLHDGRLTTKHLYQVQRRRELPTRIIQQLQVLIQQRVIRQVLGGASGSKPPLLIRLLARFPILRRLPAWFIGVGLRPEHVRTPAVPLT